MPGILFLEYHLPIGTCLAICPVVPIVVTAAPPASGPSRKGAHTHSRRRESNPSAHLQHFVGSPVACGLKGSRGPRVPKIVHIIE
ncbi:hypothetical protein GGR51DRAFT_541801 [Nemania sp. FL0031]|nr:hypothetical protein GGR51DRAFT_541801 [Nemania sp. FL0031]